MKYVKKTKPALWTTTATAVREIERINKLRRSLKEAKALIRDFEKPRKASKPHALPGKAKFLCFGRVKVAAKRLKRLKSRSSAMEAKMKIYRASKKLFLNDNPVCRCCESVEATQVHHFRGRLGPLLLKSKYWIGLCHRCHDYIHANPNWARVNGFLAAAGDWNRED